MRRLRLHRNYFADSRVRWVPSCYGDTPRHRCAIPRRHTIAERPHSICVSRAADPRSEGDFLENLCHVTFHPNPSWDPPQQQHHKVTMKWPTQSMGRRRCMCSEVTLHDPSRAIMSEQVLVHLVGGVGDLIRSQTTCPTKWTSTRSPIMARDDWRVVQCHLWVKIRKTRTVK